MLFWGSGKRTSKVQRASEGENVEKLFECWIQVSVKYGSTTRRRDMEVVRSIVVLSGVWRGCLNLRHCRTLQISKEDMLDLPFLTTIRLFVHLLLWNSCLLVVQ
jgi:hypothetical protein